MPQLNESVTIIVLGTSQDGGYPHSGCFEDCCREAWKKPNLKRLVSSLAILSDRDCLLIDITPDIKYQLQMIEAEINKIPRISGICITHAHFGHYMGLIELGLEGMHTCNVPVNVMPKMRLFLEENAPFSQLVDLNNINLHTMKENDPIQMSRNVHITPFQVPHRNEFSETVGYRIQSSHKSVLYIPDIDSWTEWDADINELVRENDIAFLDGTFYDKTELKSRNINAIPHPSIRDSMEQFSTLDKIDRKKVYFTHLNHTNNVLRKDSEESANVFKHCFNIASDGKKFLI